MQQTRQEVHENTWYRAYHVPTNRMVNVRYLGVTESGMQFEDREKRVYNNREFYFWKVTE